MNGAEIAHGVLTRDNVFHTSDIRPRYDPRRHLRGNKSDTWQTSRKTLIMNRIILVAEARALGNRQSLPKALAQTVEGEKSNAQGRGLSVSLAR